MGSARTLGCCEVPSCCSPEMTPLGSLLAGQRLQSLHRSVTPQDAARLWGSCLTGFSLLALADQNRQQYWHHVQEEPQRRPRPPALPEQDAAEHSAPGSRGATTMLLCGADMLESFIKPGVWFPEHVEEILGKHGVVCIARWVLRWRQLQRVGFAAC